MSEVTVSRDVVYGEAGAGRPLRLDLYRPVQPNGSAVVLVHGGGWSRGDKAMLTEHATHLARDGFVALVPEYRLTPEARWPAQIHDVKRAIRWTRGEAAALGFEPDRLCLQGHSAGAHLVLLAAGAPDERRLDPPEADPAVSAACAAVAAIYPPVLMYRGETRPSGGTNARALPGCDDDEACALASPIRHVSAAFPPAMLLHGDVDKVVPVSASRRFDEALRAAGGRADLHIFTGLPHGFANNPKIRPMLMTMISAFFQRTVADPAAFVAETPAAPAREPAPAWQG